MEILHKPIPAPHDYTPMVMPSGNEWEMHTLNGAELNPSAAFAPIQTAESRVPTAILHPETPGPSVYRPRTTSNGGRFLSAMPAPAAFSPGRTPSPVARPISPAEAAGRTRPWTTEQPRVRKMTTPDGAASLPEMTTSLPEPGRCDAPAVSQAEALARAKERLRERKVAAPSLDAAPRRLFDMAATPRSPSAAKWSDRVPDSLMNARRLRVGGHDSSYNFRALPLAPPLLLTTVRSRRTLSRASSSSRLRPLPLVCLTSSPMRTPMLPRSRSGASLPRSRSMPLAR